MTGNVIIRPCMKQMKRSGSVWIGDGVGLPPTWPPPCSLSSPGTSRELRGSEEHSLKTARLDG